MTLPWRAVPGGVLLDLRVTPKSGRDAIGGIEHLAGGQAVLRLRVRALPADGEANEAVIALVAKSIKHAKSNLTLERGTTARIKTLRIAGDANSIQAALQKIAGSKRDKSDSQNS
jgi:uncharacterized protein (TIGR00251 family)